ncbi:MAG: hypothetical protein WCJ88_10195 [Actinomycetes bacterium]
MFAALTSFISISAAAFAVATWILFWGGMAAVVLARTSPTRSRSVLLGCLGPIGPLIALIFVLSVKIERRA